MIGLFTKFCSVSILKTAKCLEKCVSSKKIVKCKCIPTGNKISLCIRLWNIRKKFIKNFSLWWLKSVESANLKIIIYLIFLPLKLMARYMFITFYVVFRCFITYLFGRSINSLISVGRNNVGNTFNDSTFTDQSSRSINL